MPRLERHAALIGKAILILGSPDEIPQMRDRETVNADLVTRICPRVSETSALCRLRQLVEVQGDESHAEAGEEDD